jgi:hypothetical protein
MEKQDKIPMFISHNTGRETYRRAGLLLHDESQFFEVTAEQLAILQNDPRVEMHKVLTAEDAVKK